MKIIAPWKIHIFEEDKERFTAVVDKYWDLLEFSESDLPERCMVVCYPDEDVKLAITLGFDFIEDDNKPKPIPGEYRTTGIVIGNTTKKRK